MIRLFRSQTPANVIAVLAVFFAIAGGSTVSLDGITFRAAS